MTRPAAVAGKGARRPARAAHPVHNPWNALWAMMIGFFMILVDSTIVAVANPTIMGKLNTDWDGVIWVTSAYLLAYAVPLLLAGRLGDQFGPKNLYLLGLFVFTAASLWCGLSGSIETLITARVVQGIGAALLTPQTLSTITRIFPSDRRGAAMSVWGATAGVATLVGPLAGGVLVDHLGWQWIFFVNVPIGVLGLALAVWLVPVLPTHKHRFDILGVVLSGAAMFLVVFGLQEGESHHWSPWIWTTIAGGVVLMGAFVYWQAVNKHEPLVPLQVFRDRDFSMSNVGVAVIGFAVTAMIVPVMFYAQAVCGLTPTRSALLTAPMAIAGGFLAPVVGRIVDRTHPTPIIGFGFSILAIALTWLAVEMTPTTPIWRLLLPFTAMGIGMAFIWAPLAATATRNLPPDLAGAGSGVYNATRQVGSVLGSAGIAAFMTSRISAEMPGGQAARPEGVVAQLPEFLRVPFSSALSQSMLLPAFVALFGVVTALFLAGAVRSGASAKPRRVDADNERTEVIPILVDDTAYDSPYRRAVAAQSDLFWRSGSDHDRCVGHDPYAGDGYADDDYADDDYADDDYAHDDYADDDEYIEFTVSHEPEPQPTEPVEAVADVAADDSDTEPFETRVEPPPHPPAEVWHSAPVSSWHSLLADHRPFDDAVKPAVAEPIGFAHNGFHVDGDDIVQPTPPPISAPTKQDRRSNDYYVDTFQELAENIDSLSDDFAEFMEERRTSFSFRMPEYQPPPTMDDLPAQHGHDDAADFGDRHLNGSGGRRPRHYRDDPDDSESRGRHSRPGR